MLNIVRVKSVQGMTSTAGIIDRFVGLLPTQCSAILTHLLRGWAEPALTVTEAALRSMARNWVDVV